MSNENLKIRRRGFLAGLLGIPAARALKLKEPERTTKVPIKELEDLEASTSIHHRLYVCGGTRGPHPLEWWKRWEGSSSDE